VQRSAGRVQLPEFGCESPAEGSSTSQSALPGTGPGLRQRTSGHGKGGGDASLRGMAPKDPSFPTAPTSSLGPSPATFDLVKAAVAASASDPTRTGPTMRGGSLPDLSQTDVFQRLLKERIIFLGTAIDEGVANLVCSQLLLLDAEDHEHDRDIQLYINSPGGSVTDGLAIYDTMQFVRSDVRTTCVGLAASMGQFLLCSGTPGKRYALPHSRILMHQPSGQMQGQAADIAIQAEQIVYLKRMMAERIAFHTGQPIERIEADSDRDRWFTADEAKEYGFIDQVIEHATSKVGPS
jgi:ATP-dependent Clp protease, protease subunit